MTNSLLNLRKVQENVNWTGILCLYIEKHSGLSINLATLTAGFQNLLHDEEVMLTTEHKSNHLTLDTWTQKPKR